ncbi:MAG: type II toxin-antitoxin system YoeB family toxin [Gammaproteobacteria bacterium]|nr:type II toxin-antitoxin system YoeB family toxin [Gammaproteobacteria bacterium]
MHERWSRWRGRFSEAPAAAPELGQPLRHALKGCSTRRLLAEHRLVYRCAPDAVHFLQCRYHA